MRSSRLLAVAVLVMGLMMLSPADAVKGAYPGSNGKIAFTAADPTYGDAEIFVMNPDGTGVQDLTNNHECEDYSPVWSPDGTKIAFVRHLPLGEDCEGVSQECRRIFVMNADGTGQRPLTVESNSDIYHYRPAWSPDGTKIAYTRIDFGADWSLFVIGADEAGVGTSLIPGGDGASWSPDGTKILFSFLGTSSVMIGVADANTGAVITTLIDDGHSPGWSPDGSMIVFTSNYQIWVAKADGSDQRQLTAPAGDLEDGYPNWSPDGTKIVFQRTSGSIYVMNADGSGEPIDLTPDLSDGRWPDWQRLPPAATSSAAPVGGEVASVNMFAMLAPWLAVIGLVGCMGVVGVVVKRLRP